MTPFQSNPSPEVAADRLATYVTDTRAGRERLACFEQGDLVRRVFFNAATWQPWIDGKKDPNRRATGVRRDGARGAIDRLHEAEPRQRGTHWIARPDLLELARDAEGHVGRSALFTAVMMWGSGTTNGRGPRYTASALADARLDAVLALAEALQGVGVDLEQEELVDE